MKLILALGTLAVASVTPLAAQTIVTQWNFNSILGDANVSTGVLTPAIGAGTATLIGGTTGTFASGTASGGSSDTNTTDNSGWNLTTFPASATASGTAGAQFAVSTAGITSSAFESLTFSFDQRLSNTAANTWNVDYSTNGGTSWTLAQQFTFTPAATGTGDVWYNNRSVTLTGSELFNNANLVFRIVSAFDPVTGNYLAARSTSSYGTAGTARLDMVTLSATAATVIPEPASFAGLVGLVGLGFAASRRRRA